MAANHVAQHVSECLQLAMLLEVSAYPKPGNVHRTADFSDTRYEHFLASAVAVGEFFRKAALRGLLVGQGKLKLSEVGLGRIIRDAVAKVSSRVKGGNTVLGTIILLSPLAAAAGMTLYKNKGIHVQALRRNVQQIVESTTSLDAVSLYEAIEKAKPGGLGTAPELDVNCPSSKTEILKRGISLFEVFRIAASYDSIAAEWTRGYTITFDLGYPYFVSELRRTGDFNIATVHTYLKILSRVPDTLIARKVGKAKAEEVSREAEKVLELGGLTTAEGKRRLMELDEELRKSGNRLNPGTTADMVSSVLAVGVLNGYTP